MLAMLPITTTLRLILLLSPVVIVSGAEFARHWLHPRYLHGTKSGSAAHSHQHSSDPVSIQERTLDEADQLKLAVRRAAISVVSNIDAVELQKRDINNNSAELKEKINELGTAFESLISLLATDYGVTFNLSCATAFPYSSSPPSTTASLPSSTFVIPMTSDMSSPATSTKISTYTFNPISPSNVAVYYGQTDQTSTVSPAAICADPNVDILILAFLSNFYTPYPSGLYPTLNLGPNCWAASSAQVSAGASGLIDCVSNGFAELIRTCQTTYGKKVLLSLGGAIGYSDTRIPSNVAANTLADTIWSLFLGGSGLETIRPFGDVVLDGIDIDNEDPANAIYLHVLIGSLRNNFAAAQGTKSYYLSAAPQCPRPDQSIPLRSLQTQIDFVWPQFYNNPSCNLDTDGFIPSLQAWASDLRDHRQGSFGEVPTGGFVDIGNGLTSPRLFVGAPAFANAGSGFLEEASFEKIIVKLKNTSLGGLFDESSPLGGFMFWDGAYGEESANADEIGKSYMEIVKEGLA